MIKPIPGYEELYSVTDSGEIISDRTGKSMTPFDREGYLIRELTLARREVGVALDALAGGRVEDAVPACARAVEGLCAVFLELAWPACDRAMYGEEDG